MSQPEQWGSIITFYSYKGGVGRSMAVANVARILSKRVRETGGRVLVIDWDLDAPGLHSYFPRSRFGGRSNRDGLIEYFTALRDRLDASAVLNSCEVIGECAAAETLLQSGDYILRDVSPSVDMMTAGRLDNSYQAKVLRFDWDSFFAKYSGAIEAFRDGLARRYSYVLIDARTGLTDVSGICTAIMPEKVVAVFAPNQQNLDGLMAMVNLSVEYRRASPDVRPLAVFPLPSRIDGAEQSEKSSWLLRFEMRFEALFEKLYGVSDCDLGSHFDEVQLPYVGYYSYGEKIAMLDEYRSQSLSLRRAYEVLATRLVALEYPWQVP